MVEIETRQGQEHMARDRNMTPRIDPGKIEDREAAAKAVAELRQAVRFHDYRYYVLDDPVIPDAEYDELFMTLQTLEDTYELPDADSPTRKVGGEPRAEFDTVRHPLPMLSLKAVYDEENVRAFAENCRKGLGGEPEFVAEPKYDGLSVEPRRRLPCAGYIVRKTATSTTRMA